MKWLSTMIDEFAKLFIDAAGTLAPSNETRRSAPITTSRLERQEASFREYLPEKSPTNQRVVLSEIEDALS